MAITKHDPKPEQLPLIRSDEFLPTISHWTKLGGLFLLGTVGATFALATSIHYNVTVKAPATVRPTGDLRVVQAAAEGTIVNISVKENQVVKAGQVIAYLDNAELQARKTELLETIQQNQGELIQISAQIRALEAQVIAETNLRDRSVASAQADLERVTREYQGQIQITQAQVVEAEAALGLAQEEYNRYSELGGTGAISDLQVSEKEQSLKVAEAKLEQARATLNPSTGTIAAAQERIAQEQSRGEATIASLNRERESLVQRQIQVRNQIGQSQGELQQVEINLGKSVIRASVEGIILNLNLRNQGQVVRSGEAIAQIAPANIPYIVIASVTAQDIGNVKVGQIVHLRVSAYPYPDYGTLKGKVVAVAPDATVSQGDSGSVQTPNTAGKAAFFSVTIRPEKPYLVKAGRPYSIRSGMEARADIISREETVLTFILRKARLVTDL